MTFSNLENYTHEVFNSVMEVTAEEWRRVVSPDQDVAMDQRLIHLMEQTLADQAQFFTVVIRDAAGQMVACALLCIFYVDIIQSASPIFLKIMRKIRAYWSKALKWKILFCGLPVPSGQSHLRIVKGVEIAPILLLLNQVMQQLAKTVGAQMVVFKELDDTQAHQFESLHLSGFHRGELAPLFILPGGFKDFTDYENAIRSKYRRQIQVNVKKFDQAQLTVEHFYSTADIQNKYTDTVHQLYLNVWDRANEKLECFPADFFRQFPVALPGQVTFTLISKDEKPLAFSLGLLSEEKYHNLYSGIDYEERDECDLYFNLFYRELDSAFRFNKKEHSLGQTSEQFKSRLGAVAYPRYFYVKSMNPIIRFVLSMFQRFIFPKMKKPDEMNVFKSLKDVTGLFSHHTKLNIQ